MQRRSELGRHGPETERHVDRRRRRSCGTHPARPDGDFLHRPGGDHGGQDRVARARCASAWRGCADGRRTVGQVGSSSARAASVHRRQAIVPGHDERPDHADQVAQVRPEMRHALVHELVGRRSRSGIVVDAAMTRSAVGGLLASDETRPASAAAARSRGRRWRRSAARSSTQTRQRAPLGCDRRRRRPGAGQQPPCRRRSPRVTGGISARTRSTTTPASISTASASRHSSIVASCSAGCQHHSVEVAEAVDGAEHCAAEPTMSGTAARPGQSCPSWSVRRSRRRICRPGRSTGRIGGLLRWRGVEECQRASKLARSRAHVIHRRKRLAASPLRGAALRG